MVWGGVDQHTGRGSDHSVLLYTLITISNSSINWPCLDLNF